MTPTDVFSMANLTVVPMWILMIFLPNWKMTRFLIDYKVIPLVLSLVYAMYIAQSMFNGAVIDFGSLFSVMQLFTEENAVLAGWVHYLAFDLLVGMWILDQNKILAIHHFLIVPCLLLTLMFGPVGFLLFMGIKAIKTKK